MWLRFSKLKLVAHPTSWMIFSNLSKKPYSLWINSKFKPDDPDNKLWHRIFIQMNVKLSFTLWVLRPEWKFLVSGNRPWGLWKNLYIMWKFLSTVNKSAETITIITIIIIINANSFLERHFKRFQLTLIENELTFMNKNCTAYGHSDALQS